MKYCIFLKQEIDPNKLSLDSFKNNFGIKSKYNHYLFYLLKIFENKFTWIHLDNYSEITGTGDINYIEPSQLLDKFVVEDKFKTDYINHGIYQYYCDDCANI